MAEGIGEIEKRVRRQASEELFKEIEARVGEVRASVQGLFDTHDTVYLPLIGIGPVLVDADGNDVKVASGISVSLPIDRLFSIFQHELHSACRERKEARAIIDFVEAARMLQVAASSEEDE